MNKQYISPHKLKLNPDNPRTIKDTNFNKLVNSIKEFPEMLEIRPIVVNKDLVVLGGNMRLRACKEAGLKEVPYIVADELTEEKQREFIIKDNVSGGEWDWEILANEWDAQQLNEWGLEVPDWEPEEIEAEEDDYEVPDEIQTDIVLGDLFEIGEHRLLCGNATEESEHSKLLGEYQYDSVITDPPYNVDYVGKTKDALKIKNDKMDNDSFFNFLYDFYISVFSNTKPGSSIYIFHADSEGHNFRKAFIDAGWKLTQCLIWLKNSIVMGRQDYHWKHEPILYGWKPGASHNWYSDRKQSTVLEFNKPVRNAEHPTMKPIDLMSYIIKNSTKTGDIISDPFSGSGSTMVASHQLGRKCYGMELDPKYCQVIIDRMLKLDSTLEIKRNGEPYVKG